VASSWFIKYTKKQKIKSRVVTAALCNFLSDLLYELFPLRKDIKDKVHNGEILKMRDNK
jgi:hypothetical protein